MKRQLDTRADDDDDDDAEIEPPKKGNKPDFQTVPQLYQQLAEGFTSSKMALIPIFFK